MGSTESIKAAAIVNGHDFKRRIAADLVDEIVSLRISTSQQLPLSDRETLPLGKPCGLAVASPFRAVPLLGCLKARRVAMGHDA
jgi:hypothetical protein